MSLDGKALKQLILVRYYLTLSESQFRINSEPSRFAAVNLLHESLETALIIASDYLDAKISDRATINQYLDTIDNCISPSQLPYRSRVLQFNRARISAKHGSTLAKEETLSDFFRVIPLFLRALVRQVFELELDGVSLADLIEEEKVREHILAGISRIEAGEHYEALIEARKAFYLMFEKDYDSSIFLESKPQTPSLFDPKVFSKVPHYARSEQHLSKHIRSPVDHVILDHSRVDSENLKEGINVVDFWNVWRLTPGVWCSGTGKWYVRYIIDIHQSPNIRDDALYVINAVVDMNIAKQAKRRAERYKQSHSRSIKIRPGSNVYAKATTRSEVIATIPAEVTRVNVTEALPSLDDDGWFWNVLHAKKGGPFIYGLVTAADVEGRLMDGFNPLEDG